MMLNNSDWISSLNDIIFVFDQSLNQFIAMISHMLIIYLPLIPYMDLPPVLLLKGIPSTSQIVTTGEKGLRRGFNGGALGSSFILMSPIILIWWCLRWNIRGKWKREGMGRGRTREGGGVIRDGKWECASFHASLLWLSGWIILREGNKETKKSLSRESLLDHTTILIQGREGKGKL